jgi:predicted nucleic acid-binding protein
MSEVYVLDACAMIALLRNENGADKVAAIFQKTSDGEAGIIMSKMNLLEVYYGFYQDKGREYAEKILDNIKQSIIVFTDISDTVFAEAGRLKATYRISLADAFALAEAFANNGLLLTADHHELDIVAEGEKKIKFLWIR